MKDGSEEKGKGAKWMIYKRWQGTVSGWDFKGGKGRRVDGSVLKGKGDMWMGVVDMRKGDE